jgi:hypothetical protein
MHQRIRSIIAATATAALLVGGTVATAGMSGAIFTTKVGGNFVNANVYDNAADVYLNGGPAANKSCSAAGLPDGDYIFQVTDPSGKVLLSDPSDAAERVFSVAGGVISDDSETYVGAHERGPGRCYGVTVQLWPFDLTLPTPGGEYKVWVTPLDIYDSFGFIPSYSKTDNFKVQPPDDIPD